MTATATPTTLRRIGLAVALSGALAGCQTLEVRKPTVEQTQQVLRGPEQKPFRTITGFAPALRCMDGLLLDYGVRDVSTLVEDIVDQTKKVNAGTRDMLITAFSDMTRRSRAVRVVAFGRDASNAISFLHSAQRQSAYESIPTYDIKGSVSQFDENVIRNQKDVGIGLQPFINLGVSRDAATSVLGLDLSVLSTDDLSVLAGVTSRNSVVILRTGRGSDADAAYHKFGVSYSMSLSRSEGSSQALRGLVELAAVELAGKLTKTPYWRCLEADAEQDADIRHEIGDWFHAMAASGVELIGWFQHQLRHRGFYAGPVDGQFNAAIDEAIAGYRAALGLSREALLDEPFFKAFLAADHAKVARPQQPARLAAAAPAALALSLATANQQTAFARGEPIQLVVKPSHDAFVYCYLQDENAKVLRFFPNRFAKDSLVPASRPLALPGAMRFALTMNAKGRQETIACFATPQDVSAQLPGAVFGNDFEPLAVDSLDQVRAAFLRAAAGSLAQETLHVQAR
jgi:hypothetical protein